LKQATARSSEKMQNGFAVTYVYWKPQPALQDRHVTRAEAATVAQAITKLPNLLNALGA
jgi:hypothetical protein